MCDADPLGMAIHDYWKGVPEVQIMVSSPLLEDDVMPVEYLFRDFTEMPILEQKALERSKGVILDVGAGAGSHSLWLQEHGYDVTALEKSVLACDVIRRRGVGKVINQDFFDMEYRGFDTLLMMMNGIGIAGSLHGLEKLLVKAFYLLNHGGIIIFDSSDVFYLFGNEEPASFIETNTGYYGEIDFFMYYKDIAGSRFSWLYLDFQTLVPFAEKAGFKIVEKIDGAHYDYMCVLEKL